MPFLLEEIKLARLILLCGLSHVPIFSRKSPMYFMTIRLSLHIP